VSHAEANCTNPADKVPRQQSGRAPASQSPAELSRSHRDKASRDEKRTTTQSAATPVLGKHRTLHRNLRTQSRHPLRPAPITARTRRQHHHQNGAATQRQRAASLPRRNLTPATSAGISRSSTARANRPPHQQVRRGKTKNHERQQALQAVETADVRRRSKKTRRRPDQGLTLPAGTNGTRRRCPTDMCRLVPTRKKKPPPKQSEINLGGR